MDYKERLRCLEAVMEEVEFSVLRIAGHGIDYKQRVCRLIKGGALKFEEVEINMKEAGALTRWIEGMR